MGCKNHANPIDYRGIFAFKINNHVLEWSIPFFAGAAIIVLTYPTMAFEYNLPSLLGFIPLIFFWAKLPGNPIRRPVRQVMEYSLLVFIFFASFSNYIKPPRGVIVLSEYLLISTILILGPLIYYWKVARSAGQPNEIQNP